MIEFLLKIWALTRPYRGRLLLGVLTGVIGGLIEPLMIATIAFVYGLVFPSANAPAMSSRLGWAPEFVRQWADAAQEALRTSMARHPEAIITLVAAIPAVAVLRSLFSYLNVYFLQWTAVRAVTDLRARIFSHLMNLSAGFFSRTNTGELMSRTMADTSALQNVISNSLSVIVKDPVTLVGLVGYLVWQYPRLTFISLVVMPACMVPILIYNRKARRSTRAMQTHTAELSTVMVESFSGHRIVKAYNLEPMVLEQFRDTARKFIGHYMRLVRSQEIPGPLLEAFGAIGLSLVLVYLARLGDQRPSGEDFLVVIMLIFSMYRPLKNLARLYNNLEVARAASERAFELLAVRNDVPEPANPKLLRAAGAPIRFEAVDFAYGEKPVLSDVNLTVEPGRLVALVGASGSGKTSITNLLLRFYDPTRGAVRIGDTDLRDVATDELRKQIAVVTQETVLFNQTIARNIELGRPGASQADIIQAAKHAYAYEFIMERPEGFESVIGERGTKLSVGQRQRIAIARAVLKDAPILVLDEATSALDTLSERAVQAALDRLMVGRTTICIAHRLSTVQHADLIVVVEQGRIVESGTHAELIELAGVYAKLHALQFQSARDSGPAPGLQP